MILPGMLTNFFAGGTAGILGMLLERRGAIIGVLLTASLSHCFQPYW